MHNPLETHNHADMKYIIGNLKMNLLTPAERERYFETFVRELKGKNLSDVSVVLCPPALHLEKFVEKIGQEKVFIGAQNIFWEDRGSFTGEISSLMAKQFGAEYAIVGHSERRDIFGELNATANLKIQAALKNGLIPVYCIGETKKERQSNKTYEVIARQLKEGLAEIPLSKINKVIIAYEPVWAVGSDEVPSADEIMGTKILIKKTVGDMFGLADAEKVCVLYGGSVSSKTVGQVCIEPGMDGVLVGRESLIPMEFLKIAEIINDKNR